MPYHPRLVMLLFSLRNTRSSHTRPDPTRRNRRDPEDGTEGISRFSSGKSLPFGKEYATIHFVLSRNDGIGRRGGLKIRWANTPCGFESHFRHHISTQAMIQRLAYFLIIHGLKKPASRKKRGQWVHLKTVRPRSFFDRLFFSKNACLKSEPIP